MLQVALRLYHAHMLLMFFKTRDTYNFIKTQSFFTKDLLQNAVRKRYTDPQFFLINALRWFVSELSPPRTAVLQQQHVVSFHLLDAKP